MTKPPSIVRFEQYYWASVILGLINAVTNWGAAQAVFAANPILANATWLLPVMQIVGLVISIAVWFYIVRQPAVVAKWVQVVFSVFALFGVVSALYLIAKGQASVDLHVILGLIANVLYIAAAVMVFRPDAKLWLGEGLDEDDVDMAPRL